MEPTTPPTMPPTMPQPNPQFSQVPMGAGSEMPMVEPKKPKKAKVIILVVLVILSLLGGAGFVVYKSLGEKQDGKKSQEAKQGETQQGEEKEKEETEEERETEEQRGEGDSGDSVADLAALKKLVDETLNVPMNGEMIKEGESFGKEVDRVVATRVVAEKLGYVKDSQDSEGQSAAFIEYDDFRKVYKKLFGEEFVFKQGFDYSANRFERFSNSPCVVKCPFRTSEKEYGYFVWNQTGSWAYLTYKLKANRVENGFVYGEVEEAIRDGGSYSAPSGYKKAGSFKLEYGVVGKEKIIRKLVFNRV